MCLEAEGGAGTRRKHRIQRLMFQQKVLKNGMHSLTQHRGGYREEGGVTWTKCDPCAAGGSVGRRPLPHVAASFIPDFLAKLWLGKTTSEGGGVGVSCTVCELGGVEGVLAYHFVT